MAKKPDQMRFTCTVDSDIFDKCERGLLALRTRETVQDRVRIFLAQLAKELAPKRQGA